MTYQVAIQGFEPQLVTSQHEAKRRAIELTRQGRTVRVHRITRDGAVFVAAYAPKREQ